MIQDPSHPGRAVVLFPLRVGTAVLPTVGVSFSYLCFLIFFCRGDSLVFSGDHGLDFREMT